MTDLLHRARPLTPPTASTRPADPGIEAPTALAVAAEPTAVHRSFAFLDVCGFTRYLEREGAQAAVRLLRTFRDNTRDIGARRGVRTAKWLGDGVMLVGVDAGPMTAMAVELSDRIESEGIGLRAGVATGSCLLFEGDDYIGHPVNLASRLSDAAGPGEILADVNSSTLAPDWIHVGRPSTYKLHGVGKVHGVRRLSMSRSSD